MVANHTAITIALVGGVAAISLFLAAAAIRARIQTGNAKLAFVAAAFAVFCVKSLVTAYALLHDPTATAPARFALTHGHLEFLNSALDLVIVALLVAPFLRPR